MNVDNSRQKAWRFFKPKKNLSKEQVTLFQICWSCGKTGGKIELHHDDYYRPLMVIPLCTKCHVSIHKTDVIRGISRMCEFKKEGLLRSKM